MVQFSTFTLNGKTVINVINVNMTNYTQKKCFFNQAKWEWNKHASKAQVFMVNLWFLKKVAIKSAAGHGDNEISLTNTLCISQLSGIESITVLPALTPQQTPPKSTPPSTYTHKTPGGIQAFHSRLHFVDVIEVGLTIELEKAIISLPTAKSGSHRYLEPWEILKVMSFLVAFFVNPFFFQLDVKAALSSRSFCKRII